MSELIAQTFTLRKAEEILVAGQIAPILNEEGPFTALLPWDMGIDRLQHITRMTAPRIYRYWTDHFAAFMRRHIARQDILDDAGNLPNPGTRLTLTMMDDSQIFIETGRGSQRYWEREPYESRGTRTLSQTTVTNGTAFIVDNALTPSFSERSLRDSVALLGDEYATFKGLIECFLNNPNEDDRWIVDAMTAHRGDALRDRGLTILAPTDTALNSWNSGEPVSPENGCEFTDEQSREEASFILRSHILDASLPSAFFGTGATMMSAQGTEVTFPELPADPCEDCGTIALAEDPETRVATIEHQKVLAVSGIVYGVDALLTSGETIDPGERGTLATASISYHIQRDGSDYFSPDNAPNWVIPVRGTAYYPADISDGPYPIIVIVPMREFRNRIPDLHRRYDYLAEHLASQGFIAVSIDVDEVNHNGNTGEADLARVSLLEHHISLWTQLNAGANTILTDNPFAGNVDTNNLGLIGHSKGGAAVADYYSQNRHNLVSRPKAIFLLAPMPSRAANLWGVPFGVMLPYCDGDVHQLEGMQYYSDHRYSRLVDEDTAPHYAFLAHGANHNWFADIPRDDWRLYASRFDEHCSLLNPDGTANEHSGRLEPEEQQTLLSAYTTAFFRSHLNHEDSFIGMLTGEDLPGSTQDMIVESAYHAPVECRMDINRFDSEETLYSSNVLGGAVSSSVEAEDRLQIFLCEDELFCDFWDRVSRPESSPMMRVHWDAAANADWFENRIPDEFRDFRGFTYLQFRTTVEFELSAVRLPQDFTVQLRDGSGHVESIRVGEVSDALRYPPGTWPQTRLLPTPRKFSSTVRIPLSRFSTVDLSQIEAIRFVFDQTSDGAIFLSDLSISLDAMPNQSCQRVVRE